MSVSIRDRIEEIMTTPSTAQFLYYFVVVTSGLFILRFSIEDGIIFGRALLLMAIWFILMISLQPPKGAEFEAEPFLDTGIIEGMK